MCVRPRVERLSDASDRDRRGRQEAARPVCLAPRTLDAVNVGAVSLRRRRSQGGQNLSPDRRSRPRNDNRARTEAPVRSVPSARESPRHRPRDGCVRVRDRPRKRRAPQGARPRVRGARRRASARSCACRTIFDGVQALIAEHAPDAVALEESFVGADARIALSVGQARGAVLVAAASAGVDCAEYAPARVKQAVCGYGRAEKAQVQRMVQRDPRARREPPTPNHAADALAVAICHALAPPLLRGSAGMIARLRGAPRRRSTPRGSSSTSAASATSSPRRLRALRKRRGDGEVVVETYLHVREDVLQLYGFADAAERELFIALLGVNGVGPKVALAIVSGSPPESCGARSCSSDAARFEAIPGIGKKTAERIVLELKEKLGADDVVPAAAQADVDARRRARRARRARLLARRGRARARRRPIRAAGRGARPPSAEERGVSDAVRGAGARRRGRGGSSARSARAGWTTSSARSASRSSSTIALAAARARGEALDHVLLAGPPGPRQDDASRYIVREELGVGIRTVAGPGARAQGRHRRDPHLARAARRALRRRDPPAQPVDRGDPLPGARGLPARHRRRAGAGGAHADARPAAVHARRRDDAHRAPDDAAARPLRDHLPPRLLRAGGARRRSCAAPRASSASRSTTTPPRRSRAARAARRASRTGSSGACATSPRCATKGAITTGVAARRSSCSRSTSTGSSAPTASCCARSSHKFGGGPVGLSTLAVALGEEPDTIEDVYEPYLLQLGFLQRTPRGRIVTELGRAHIGAAAPAGRAVLSTAAIWTPGTAGPLDELVSRIRRAVEAFAQEHGSSKRRSGSSFYDGRELVVASISPEPGFGFLTLQPHQDDGGEPSRVIVPIGAVKLVEISTADPERPSGSPSARRQRRPRPALAPELRVPAAGHGPPARAAAARLRRRHSRIVRHVVRGDVEQALLRPGGRGRRCEDEPAQPVASDSPSTSAMRSSGGRDSGRAAAHLGDPAHRRRARRGRRPLSAEVVRLDQGRRTAAAVTRSSKSLAPKLKR